MQIKPISSEAEYDEFAAFLNALLDVVGEDEDHPLFGLLDKISDEVLAFEQVHYSIK